MVLALASIESEAKMERAYPEGTQTPERNQVRHHSIANTFFAKV